MYKPKQNRTLLGSRIFVAILFSLIAFKSNAQTDWIREIAWKNLTDGLQYTELETPEKSVVGDSRISILKVDSHKFDFEFLTASERGHHARTAPEWAQEFNKNIIINAGMYKYNKTQSN